MDGTDAVNLSQVLTWPQALVGALIVIVAMGLPQVLTYLSNKQVKKQVTNNGGSSMKDAVDRIEKKTDTISTTQNDFMASFDKHIEDAKKRDERIVRLETFLEIQLAREAGSNGGDNSGTVGD
jgi:hypothetical protein